MNIISPSENCTLQFEIRAGILLAKLGEREIKLLRLGNSIKNFRRRKFVVWTAICIVFTTFCDYRCETSKKRNVCGIIKDIESHKNRVSLCWLRISVFRFYAFLLSNVRKNLIHFLSFGPQKNRKFLNPLNNLGCLIIYMQSPRRFSSVNLFYWYVFR